MNTTNQSPIPWEEKPADCTAPVWRWSQNPVIDREPIPSAMSVYNSAVIPFGDGFAGVFRADQKKGAPWIHAGFSKDAIHWDINDENISFTNKIPGHEIEYGYDPRVVELDGEYYVTWCNGIKGQPTIGIAKTNDFKTFEQLENAFLPFNRNGVFFPRKINGKYVMLSRPSDSGHTPFGDIYLSESPDLCHWGRHRHVMSPSHDWWQGLKIGAGPIPIETSEGWLMIYHGVMGTCNGFVYSMGGAILDIDDPSNVLYRTQGYLIRPEAPYEISGHVPNVIFPCAALHEKENGRLAIYYGAADTFTALAFAQIDELLEYIKNDS